MTRHGKIYPDIADVLARKERGRAEAAKLSFGEKIAIVEAMRERLAPLKHMRDARPAADPLRAKLSSR